MKKRLNPVVVGAFALGALLLGTVALVSFGAGRWFRDPVRFVIDIRGASVSGLEAGSPVKLRGVRIGRVQSVAPRYDRESDQFTIRVVCDVDEGAARGIQSDFAGTPDEALPLLITKGLEAKLNFGGITGMLYVDLYMEPPTETIEVAYDDATGAPIVPTAPSLLAEFTDSFSKVATGLGAVDFAGISAELKTLLESLNQAVADADVRRTIAGINAATSAVTELAASPELQATLANLGATVQQLHDLLAGLEQATPELQAQLTATLNEAERAMNEFAQASQNLNNLMSPRGGLPQEIADSLDSVQRAARAAERLADYLERNPGALLRGRAPANN